MTPKEKANFLLHEMISQTWNFSSHHLNALAAKQCSIVAIDQIINTFSDIDERRDYWNEVKNQIQLL